MSLKNQLNRFKAHLTVEKPLQELHEEKVSQPLAAVPNQSVEVPYLDRWNQLQAKPVYDLDMHVMVREVRYPLSHVHGTYPLSELQRIMDLWNQRERQHPLSSYGRRAQDLLFFDTETTGLQGGAGNTIFLLGLGQMQEDAVVVKQFFLPGPEHEIAMYRAFVRQIKASTHLVTYNGKSFDWPQVKTRHTLVRDEVPPLPVFSHFDLLHGARRLWKNTLESCKLSIVEQHILGFERVEDTPGFMAPYLYFEYLRSRDPEGMTGMLQHNEWDVLSLITLYIHISKLLLDSNTSCSGEERLEIARWYEAAGDLDHAVEGYSAVMTHYPVQRGQAMLALASLHRKQKNWSEAVKLWEGFCNEQSFVPISVYTELAKIYEHHLHDLDRALFFADRAWEQWNGKREMIRKSKGDIERNELQQRIARLERKIRL